MNKVEVQIALEFDNIENMKRAIEINEGISILPEPTISREVASGSLVGISLEGSPICRPLGIIHRRDQKLGPLGEQFVSLLQEEASFCAPPLDSSMEASRDSAARTA